MDVHIGKEIEARYYESGMKLSEFAKRLDTSTRNVYSIFTRPDINSALLMKISDVLKFDFFKFYQQTLPDSGIPTTIETKRKLTVIVELDGDVVNLQEWIKRLSDINRILQS